MAIIKLNNTTVLYLKEVTKFLALVCILREESFERKGMLQHFLLCYKQRSFKLLVCWFIVCPKMKILTFIYHPQVVPNMYTFLYAKKRCFNEDLDFFPTMVVNSVWLQTFFQINFCYVKQRSYFKECGKENCSRVPLTTIVHFSYYGSQ